MPRLNTLASTLALTTTLFVSGCATVGQDFATENVGRLQVDQTTRADVKNMFGEPWRTGIEDGKRTWTYGKYQWSAFSPAETTDLVVRFNNDGTVATYVYNTTEKGSQ